ncbi:MAG: SAM-dependent DNA methyltransferase, partial [Solirubrobacterales bacterium]
DTEMADEQRVKIFPNEEFGFLRITVERPLRLKWEVTDASADALLADKKLAKLDEQQRQALVEHARGRVGTTFDSEAAARKEAKRWMADLHLDGKPIENAIVDALAVRDPDAAPITDKHGQPEPDPDLRDNENVPLPNEPVRYEPDPTDRLATDTYRKAVEQYVEQEVHPYVPDAWIDHTKTKIGYEIPLTRHFYVYTPPRPLDVIDAEIKQLEAEIQELLREVTE